MSALTILASTLGCLLLHLVIHKSSGQPFAISLKLSRGIMALLMVLAGAWSLWRHFSLWPQVFLIQQPGPSPTSHLVSAFCGLLLADLIWLAVGLRLGADLRHDLVVHHVLGLALCATAFHFEAGYILVLVALITELMPVTTGISGIGDVLGSRRIKNMSSWLGLMTILVVRLPMWIFFFARVVLLLQTGQTIAALEWIYLFGLALLIAVTCLDGYWTRVYLKSLLKGKQQSPDPTA